MFLQLMFILHDVKFGIILFGSKSETIIDINDSKENTKEAIKNKLDAIYDIPKQSVSENNVSAVLLQLVKKQILPSANINQNIVSERHVFLMIDSKKIM